jgi:hypothetical protein
VFNVLLPGKTAATIEIYRGTQNATTTPDRQPQ